MIRLLSLSFLALFYIACFKPTKNIYNVGSRNPPGTIKIGDNLYFDKTEHSNINYKEFLYWQRKHYGVNSKKYLDCLPQSNVWHLLDEAYGVLDTLYLTNNAFDEYPVVGVSYQQALTYAKWRSDRVMEMYLVTGGLFKARDPNYKDSLFTIEKYFSGNYNGIKPDPNILTYPLYTLPDSTTYMLAAMFADSLNAKNYKYCRHKDCQENLLVDCNCFENKKNVSPSLPYGEDVVMSTKCQLCKKELITHLKGNLREMTNIKGKTYGCSYYDKCNGSYNSIRISEAKPNSYTGYRNMCRYVAWKQN
jgi:hypothetical protein